jgi:hypothetical protein
MCENDKYILDFDSFKPPFPLFNQHPNWIQLGQLGRQSQYQVKFHPKTTWTILKLNHIVVFCTNKNTFFGELELHPPFAEVPEQIYSAILTSFKSS